MLLIGINFMNFHLGRKLFGQFFLSSKFGQSSTHTKTTAMNLCEFQPIGYFLK
jgi:hypothetical protein